MADPPPGLAARLEGALVQLEVSSSSSTSEAGSVAGALALSDHATRAWVDAAAWRAIDHSADEAAALGR